MDRTMLILAGVGIALAALYASDAFATINPAPDDAGDPLDPYQGFAVGEWGYNDNSPSTSSDSPVDTSLQAPDPWLDWLPTIVTGKPKVTGSQPLGLSQNNPGNLRAWQAGQPTAHGFRVFDTMQAGLDELARQLLVYAKRGKNSIRQIVTTFAPPAENNTAAYIANVSGWMGIAPDTVLNLNDTNTLANLMGAIVRQEQGQLPFNPAELAQAAYERIGKGTAVA